MHIYFNPIAIIIGILLTIFFVSIILEIGNNDTMSKIIAIIAVIFCVSIYIQICDGQARYDKNQKHNTYKIHKEIKQILNIKTKYNISLAYLYGVYSDNSLSKDKDIISCYKKFHNVKATAECLRGKLIKLQLQDKIN